MPPTADVAVIILIRDELIHIRRCLERLAPLRPQKVFVVDSPSTDGGDRVAAEMGATVVAHAYPGNQADQFNWALDHLPITAKWVLRLDADEYLSEGLIAEIRAFVAAPPEDVLLVRFPLGRVWMGRRVRFGVGRIEIPRLLRFGRVRYAAGSLMDERFAVEGGRVIAFRHEFVDDNLNTFDWWRRKHLGYAEREARQALKGGGRKAAYYRLPPYLRALAYWGYRYFLRLGFLDGRAGWSWNFWQGLWYRWTVDRRIRELKAGDNVGARH